MAILTEKYGLTAFTRGDVYSARADRDRFTKIDTQMAFIADVVGDGVIEGWNVVGTSSSSLNPLDINILSGSGLIDRHHVRTFGDISATLAAGKMYYVYMQKKLEYNAGFSGFSNIANIVPYDITSPATPSNLSYVELLYNSVTLSWDNNLEPDFASYKIFRSEDGINYAQIGTAYTNSYIDTGLLENKNYNYKIKSIDLTGNESVYSSVLNILTPYDLSIPSNPTNVNSFSGDSFIELTWRKPDVGSVASYDIELYLLDSNESITGLVESVNTTNLNYVFYDLNNDDMYEVRIFSKTLNNIRSTGLSSRLSVFSNSGTEEVRGFSLSENQSSKNANNVEINVSGYTFSNPYKLDATKAIVTIIENGMVVSSSLVFYPKNNDKYFIGDISFSFDSYKVGSVVKPIKPYTNYGIKLQLEDDLGNVNKGIICYIDTSNYVSPNGVTNLKPYIQKDESLLFSWTNSSSRFSYNSITLRKTKVSGVIETLLNNVNIGKDTFYKLEDPLESGAKYEIYVSVYDKFNLVSEINSVSYTFKVLNTALSLSGPINQYVLNGDRCVFVSWEDNDPLFSKYFYIWRADSINVSSGSDFKLVAKVEAPNNSYIDYGLTNNNRYIYFVTRENIYGQKTKDPSDNFIMFSYIYGYPNQKGGFEVVSDVSLVQDGYNCVLSWTGANDSFDGWEIYRKDEVVDWKKVGFAKKNDNSFIDYNSLLVGGIKYSYMIRKYRDEGRLEISEKPNYAGTLLLATVDTSLGFSDVTTLSSNVKNLHKIISEFSTDSINDHNHVIDQININEYVTISNWTTTDNKIFTTTEYMNGGYLYIPYIGGVKTSVNFNIIAEEKKIIFNSPLSSASLKVKCLGVNEIRNILKNYKVKNVSSSILSSGVLQKNLLPDININGRVKEKLVPIQLRMISDNSYLWKIEQNEKTNTEESIGSTVSFYDILFISGVFIVATSGGIKRSTDNGVSWDTGYSSKIVHKLYYSSLHNRYFALTDSSILFSKDGISWKEVSGLEHVEAVRCICESGNILIGTNSGIYSISSISMPDNPVAERISLMSNITSDSYSMLYNSYDAKVYSGTSVGLFYSTDSGISWVHDDSFLFNRTIHGIYQDANYLFALTEDAVYRKDINFGDFEQIYYKEDGEFRKIIKHDNRIVLSGKDGLYVSDEYIYDSKLNMNINAAVLNRKSNTVYGLSVFGDLFVGVDGALIKTTNLDRYEVIYRQLSSVTPTFYIDGKQISSGVFYSIGNNSLHVDKGVQNSLLTVANQYKVYKVENEGWIEQNYKSIVKVNKNNSLIYSFTSLPTLNSVINSLKAIRFSSINSTNSNYDSASTDINSFNYYLNRLERYNNGTLTLSDDETEQKLIGLIMFYYYAAFSKMYKDQVYYGNININSKDYIIDGKERIISDLTDYYFYDINLVPLPNNITLEANTVNTTDGNQIYYENIVDGIFVFVNSYDKYDDLTITLSNSSLYDSGSYTMKEVEDLIEVENSGLTASFSEVQHSLLLSSISSVNKIYPSNLEEKDYCEKIIVKYNNVNIDNVIGNYDTLNSTLNWRSEKEIENNVNKTLVPICICYFENYIVFSTIEDGLFKIDKATQDTSKIDYIFCNGDYVVDMIVVDGVLFCISNRTIKYTTDLIVWNNVETNELSGSFIKFVKFGSIYIVATSNGVYYKYYYDKIWIKSIDLNGVTLLINANFLFALADGVLYISKNGYEWNESSDFSSVGINDIKYFLGHIYIASNNGLRSDLSSFYSSNPITSLVNVTGISLDSRLLCFNSISINSAGTELTALSSDGYLYTTVNGNDWIKSYTNMPTAHLGVYTDSEFWSFGCDLLKTNTQNVPIKIMLGDTI